MTYETLRWDSEFFGFPIGRINEGGTAQQLARVLARADADGIRCLYDLVPVDDLPRLHEALRHGFEPYDIRIEFERSLDAQATHPANEEIREADPSDEDALADLAAQTIEATRFALDPHFPRDRIPLLYAEWVKRGIQTRPARRVFVAEPMAGFVVCGFGAAEAVGSIELIGVAARFERQGIGRLLMSQAHASMIEAGCDRARVVTQARNLRAQGLYQAVGYRTRAVAWWLHRWHPS